MTWPYQSKRIQKLNWKQRRRIDYLNWCKEHNVTPKHNNLSLDDAKAEIRKLFPNGIE